MSGPRCDATSGYFIKETFARICRELLTGHELCAADFVKRIGYSIPRVDMPPEQMPRQYRGLQREPMLGWVREFDDSGVVEPTEEELEHR